VNYLHVFLPCYRIGRKTVVNSRAIHPTLPFGSVVGLLSVKLKT
jgi:hypothetical protein